MIYSFSVETLLPWVQGLFDKSGISESDLTLTEEDGKTYISKDTVDKIANAANDLGYFKPEGVKLQYLDTEEFGLLPHFTRAQLDSGEVLKMFLDTKSFEYYHYGSLVGNITVDLKARDEVHFTYLSRTSELKAEYNGVYTPVPIGTILNSRTILSSYANPKDGVLLTPMFVFDIGNGFSSVASYFSRGSYVSKEEGYKYLFDTSTQKWTVGLELKDSEGRTLGGICIPNGGIFENGIAPAKDAQLPSISADGKVDGLPKVWEEPRVIAGNPSLPLTVPKDMAGVKDLTQDKAQAGTKEDSKADSPTDTKKPVSEEDIKKVKLPPTFKDYFPFCIPFDVIRGFKLLLAPAKDPIFNIPIKFPYMAEANIVIDLTKYSAVFSIVRWFIVLIFTCGLAASTKKFIKW